jgi:hypothetical protein
MPVPGYNAEASIYRSAGQYRAAMVAGTAPPDGVAVPSQAGLSCSPCDPDSFSQTCSYTQACTPPPPPPPPECRNCRSKDQSEMCCTDCYGGNWTGNHCQLI